MAYTDYTEYYTATVKIASSTPTFTSELLLQAGERLAVFYRTGASFVSDFSNELVLSAQSDASVNLTLQVLPPNASMWLDLFIPSLGSTSWAVAGGALAEQYSVQDLFPEPCSVRFGTKNNSAYSDGNIWVRIGRGN